MPQEPNNDYDNLFEVLNSFTTLIEVESEAVRDIVPGATGAALTAQVAKIANLSFDIAAIAYAYKTAPQGEQRSALINASANFLVPLAVEQAISWRTAPLGPVISNVLGAASGTATSIGLQWMNVEATTVYSSVYELAGQSLGRVVSEFTTSTGQILKRITDLDTSEVSFRTNDIEVLRLRLNANDQLEALTVRKLNIEASLNLLTGGYQIKSATGELFLGNLADPTLPVGAQAQLNILLDAFDAEFLASEPGFQGVRTLFPNLSFHETTGFTQLLNPGWKTFSDGDFTYRYDTASSHFEISSKTVNAHYGTDGAQTIMYTDPGNGQWYFLQIRPDGSKFLAYTGHEQGINFNKYGELPDHYQGALQRMDAGAYAQIGSKVHDFFQDYPSENSNLPGFLANMAGDPGLLPVPPIPGRKPPVPGQTDAESAENGATYTLTEERTVIINGQTYALQQFSSRVDVDSFTNSNLVDLVKGEYFGYTPQTGNDIRIRALSELAIRWEEDPQALIADNIAFVPGGNGGALSAVLISGQSAIGSITAVQKGNFKIQAVEVIGDINAGISDAVQIVTEDLYAGAGSRSQVLNLTYPESFNFQYTGGYFGGLLGGIVADDNLFKQVVYKTVFTTAGQTLGTFADFLAVPQNTLEAARYGATQGVDIALREDMPELSARLAGNLAATVANVLGQRIVDELTEAVQIDGIAGEIFDVAVGTVTVGALNDVLNFTFRGLDGGLYANLFKHGFTADISDAVQLEISKALAGYVGTRLAGELIAPESQQAAIFGSIGSALATSITTNAGMLANLAISKAVSGAFASFGSFAPVVGTAIGAFVGQIVGTAIGNLFASEDDPISWAAVKYDSSTSSYYLNAAWGDDGGNPQVAHNMATALISGVNDIVELTGGALRRSSNPPTVELGLDGDRFGVIVDGTAPRYFNSAAEAIQHAALNLLKGFDLVGGYAILMRAWHNSDATTLQEFKDDLEVAEAFQAYLANPTGIIALMLDQPNSPAALAWAKVLERAGELELHIPHERDLDGGWGELLSARGDIDPSLIPSIDGEAIVVTDPATGEQIRLEHVIGPGYEIVRVPGTDGNDIIDLVVDGPSITYVDAMAGDDIINGSDERDIILGGAGNDTINGNAGDDWINGGSGNDTINGNGGLDLIYGSDDDDILTGAEQNDDIYGGAGNDILRGMGGYDRLYGGDGNDTLYSTEDIPGDDLYGQGGDDTIDVDTRYSNVYGGTGNDLIILRDHSNTVHVSRGDGNDTIVYSGTTPNTIRFDRTISINELWFQKINQDLKILVLGENQSVTIDHYYDRPNAFAIEARDGYLKRLQDPSQLHLFHQQFSSQPSGTYNIVSDTVLTSLPSTTIWAMAADVGVVTTELDTNQTFINVSGPNRIVIGGNGNDTFQQESSSVSVYGGAGTDTITGNLNQIASTHGFFYGDAGADYITGSLGQDSLFGGTGNDEISGDGNNDYISGNHGNDKLWGGSGHDYLEGGVGNDYLNGDAGDDELIGGDGDDRLTDAYGNNIMKGGAGADIITAGAGNDNLDGGAGNDSLTGGAGNDRLSGGDDTDTLLGGTGNDQLSGGNGNDTLDGGGGNDALYGGDGDDTLIYTLSDNTAATETIDGGAGSDKLRVNLTAAQYSVAHNVGDLLRLKFALSEHASQTTQSQFSFVFTAFALSILSVEQLELFVDGTLLTINHATTNGLTTSDTISTGAGHNLVYAFAGDDTVTAFAGDDIILGGDGNDIINAGQGWNLVRGEAGDDTITTGDNADDVSGGEGNDTINAGAGNDALSGGDGNDILLASDGDDVVTAGFGTDTLDGGSGADRLYGQADDDTLSGGDGADTLDGGSGNDELRGGKHADTLTGGAGADTFVWMAGDLDGSVDTITDWKSADGDVISLDRVLTYGRLPTDDINDYLRLTTTGTPTLSVDVNGLLGGSSFSPLIQFTNPTGLTTIAELLAAGRIHIVPINNDPVAQPDAFTFFVGGSFAGNVLVSNGNGADSDPDGDTLSLTPATITTAQGGSVVLSANGNFIYTPLNGTITADSFSYSVSDGFGGTATANAQITISQPNQAPVLTPDTYTVVEDVVTGFTPLFNDTDPEGNALTIQHVTLPLFGTASLSGATVTYTPARNYAGPDSLLYLVSDTAGNLAVSKATITTNYDTSHIVRQGTAGNDNWDNTGTTHDTYYLGLGDDYAKSWGGDDIAYYTGGKDTLFSKTPGSVDLIHIGGSYTVNDATIAVSDFTYATHNSGGGYFDHIMISFDTANRIVLQSAARADNTEYRWDKVYFSDGFSVSLDTIENWVTAANGNANNNTVFGNASANTLSGGAGNDEMIGYGGDDILSGDDGLDLIYGGTGNDTLTGGNGDDKLWGSLGNDSLAGGAGSDFLFGGLGADTFRLDSATGIDHIKDFSVADGDILDISDLISSYDPITDAIADFIRITESGGHSIIAIDATGSGNSYQARAILENATGLTDEDALLSAGRLAA